MRLMSNSNNISLNMNSHLPQNFCIMCARDFADGENVIPLPCSHKFHTDCITRRATVGQIQCPTCNKTFTQEQIDQMAIQDQADF